MAQYNPQVDLIFKKIFGVEENKDLLISLINSIVDEADQVKDVIIKNPYNQQNFMHDKLSILDIKAEGITGKLYNIEIQITDEKNYEKRALYYWGKMYSDQLRNKGEYRDLRKAIGIHLLNFDCIRDPSLKDRYHNVFGIKERTLGFPYFRDLELHTIELNKFADLVKDKDELTELELFKQKVHRTIDWWIGFLTRYDLIQKVDDINPDVKKAIDVLEYMYLSDQEREAYDDREKYLLLINDALEKQMENGIELGRQMGLEEGLEKGKEIGFEEGEKSAQYKLYLKKISRGKTDNQIKDEMELTNEEFEILKSFSNKST